MILNINTERAVLGSLLTGADFEEARSLSPDDFGHPPHRPIWTAILNTINSGKQIDHLVIASELVKIGKLEQSGGAAYLMELDQCSPITSNLPAHISTLKDLSLRRSVAACAQQVALLAGNPAADPVKVALEGSGQLASLCAAGTESFQTFEHALAGVQEQLHQNRLGTKHSVLWTGIDVWDELLGGLQTGILTLIGAYPAVGKSALKNAMAFNLAQSGVPVGVFELEDPKEAMGRRHVAYGSKIPVRKLKTEALSDSLFARANKAIEAGHRWAHRLFIDNRRRLKASQIAATMRQMIVQRGCKAIFIDHANEIIFDAGLDRNDLNISDGIRMIRDVAIELNVALVMLQHFSRPKHSNDKEPRYNRPNSGIWKNSGGFEESARVAVGLYLDRSMPDGVMASVLKQNEGQQDFDFFMPMHKASGLIESVGGYAKAGTVGYDDPETCPENKDENR